MARPKRNQLVGLISNVELIGNVVDFDDVIVNRKAHVLIDDNIQSRQTSTTSYKFLPFFVNGSNHSHSISSYGKMID